MKTFLCFLKKEITENIRNGRYILMIILAVLLGIMAPGIAKLTPTILEMAAKDETGIQLVSGDITAFDSWQQFYKNAPILLIMFIVMYAGTLVNEYQKGTLILVVTKGLKRWKVYVAKAISMLGIWTAGYWLSYGITYYYTSYYWDNSVVLNCWFVACCYWLFGVLMIALIMLSSSMAKSFGGAIAVPVGFFFIWTIVGIIKKVENYLPTKLLDSTALKVSDIGDYYPAMIVSMILIVCGFIIGGFIFNKREL